MVKFHTSTIFTVHILKLKPGEELLKSQFYHGVIPQNDAKEIANCEEPDQSAPLGAV